MKSPGIPSKDDPGQPRRGTRPTRLGESISATAAALLIVGALAVGSIPLIESKPLDGHTILAVLMVVASAVILDRLHTVRRHSLAAARTRHPSSK